LFAVVNGAELAESDALATKMQQGVKSYTEAILSWIRDFRGESLTPAWFVLHKLNAIFGAMWLK